MRGGISRTAELLYPLSEFYKVSGVELPGVREITPPEIPEPYRQLLVHGRDMTPTLEAAWGGELHIRALRHARHQSVYMRQSLLLIDNDATPKAMGAISINLDHFPEPAQRLVLEQRVPLGLILRDHGIAHQCRPSAYFEIAADPIVGDALGAESGTRLYGRQNVMWGAGEYVLAEVIEILPAVDPPRISGGKDAVLG